jgi:hypothetical protein
VAGQTRRTSAERTADTVRERRLGGPRPRARIASASGRRYRPRETPSEAATTAARTAGPQRAVGSAELAPASTAHRMRKPRRNRAQVTGVATVGRGVA